MAFGLLFGTPITGALLDRSNGEFTGAVIFSGVCALVGGSIMAAARINKGGFSWEKH